MPLYAKNAAGRLLSTKRLTNGRPHLEPTMNLAFAVTFPSLAEFYHWARQNKLVGWAPYHDDRTAGWVGDD